jgi:hypothetical protein
VLNGYDDRRWWSRLTPAERRQQIRRWSRQPSGDADGDGQVETEPGADPEPETEPGTWTEQDIQDEVEALDAPPELALLIARARAAGHARLHACLRLPDPAEPGISTPERRHRMVARDETHAKALADERRWLARAVAEACRVFGEDLSDAWDLALYQQIAVALQELAPSRP